MTHPDIERLRGLPADLRQGAEWFEKCGSEFNNGRRAEALSVANTLDELLPALLSAAEENERFKQLAFDWEQTAGIQRELADSLRAELERMTSLRDGWGAAAKEAQAHADRYRDERDTLRAEENERLRAELWKALEDYGFAVMERDSLRAEVEALRKDAGRYRWLKDKAEIIRVSSGQVIAYPAVRLYESIHGPDFRGQPDAAIDAAILTKESQP